MFIKSEFYMSKKEINKGLNTSQRKVVLDMCYKRLREMIPECTNEVTLIKCIEILEKREESTVDSDDSKTLRAISITLDRLAELK